MVFQMFRKRTGWRLVRMLATCVLALQCGFGWAQAPPAASAPPQAAATRPPLVNGIFVAATGTSYRDPLRIDRFCANLRALPFDEIVLQVMVDGEALYDSALLPRALGVEHDFDPLGAMLKQLRAPSRPGEDGKPKKVIAWIEPYRLGLKDNPAGLNPKSVAALHPGWLAVRADGETTDEEGRQYLDPLVPEAQLFAEQLVAELVKQYPLDGLVIDGVADPAGDGRWGFHPLVIEAYQRAANQSGTPDPGQLEWIKFRADGLTAAAEGLVGAVRQTRPNLPVALTGEATGPAPADAQQFTACSVFRLRRQDWPRWLARGVGQRFYLKDFASERAAADDFNQWLALALHEAAPRPVPVVATVLGKLNESVDALAQLRRAATGGAAGIALMDYDTPVADAGARELFMSAVARAVLAPGSTRLRLTPRSTTETTVAAAAPNATVPNAAGPDDLTPEKLSLRPVLRGNSTIGTTPAPADASTSGGEPTESATLPPPPGSVDLPPPPPLSEVLGDTTGRPPLAEVVEEGAGSLIPAQADAGRGASRPVAPSGRRIPLPRTRGENGRDGDEMLGALNRLAGMDLSGEAINQTSPPPPAPSEYVTRREMLNEILGAPVQPGAERRFFNPDPQAVDELRKRFGNIF